MELIDKGQGYDRHLVASPVQTRTDSAPVSATQETQVADELMHTRLWLCRQCSRHVTVSGHFCWPSLLVVRWHGTALSNDF